MKCIRFLPFLLHLCIARRLGKLFTAFTMLILSPGILRSAVGALHRWKRGLASLSQHQPSPSQTAPSPGPSMHEAKQEGTIETFFQSLTDAEQPPLPPRFSALKKEIIKDPQALERSWKAVLKELEGATDEIAKKENEVSGLCGSPGGNSSGASALCRQKGGTDGRQRLDGAVCAVRRH